MSDPENALEQARAAAAQMRSAGAYSEPAAREPAPDGTVPGATLAQWAVIEPDLSSVTSTRRYGAALTALKLSLVRLLRQYHADMLSQQTRFNVKIVEELGRLERRLDALEQKLDERS